MSLGKSDALPEPERTNDIVVIVMHMQIKSAISFFKFIKPLLGKMLYAL